MLVGHYVQLQPPAEGPNGRPLEEDWRIAAFTNDAATLEHARTGATVRIGLDGLYSYVPDPPRSTASEPHGVRQLHVVLRVAVDGAISVTPLPPPPW
jgi:hypothetical protein